MDRESVAPSKLHLGCGTKILPGYVNADILKLPGVERVFDAAQGLPFPDGSLDEILAEDFLAHVPPEKSVFIMNELHRVLRPAGRLRLKFPEAPGITAFQDPTHVSFWNEEKLTYFLSGHRRREQYGIHHGVTAKFNLVKQERWLKQPSKFLTTLNFNYLLDYLLRVELEALK